jgi:hypothetical protein
VRPPADLQRPAICSVRTARPRAALRERVTWPPSGSDFLPYSHGRHDAEKGKLGASIQYDCVGIVSVPGRGKLNSQPVTNFFADGDVLWASRDRNIMVAAIQHLQPVELLQRRFADARSAAGGPGPGSGEHCYMLHVAQDFPYRHRPAAVGLVAT